MSSNVVNQMPYLRTSREFPTEMDSLVVQLSKDHIDFANVVNDRTIGLFPTTRPAINGEAWFLSANQKQQGLRQVYTFTSTAAITHNIQVLDTSQFIRCFGSFTDGTKCYGLIFGNIGTPIAGQIVFDVTTTQIEFAAGAGAPTVTKGTIVLEWISQV